MQNIHKHAFVLYISTQNAKSKKYFKKHLTLMSNGVIITKLSGDKSCERAELQKRGERLRKNFKKVFKKYLTSPCGCGNIVKHSEKRGCENGSLKIEQCNIQDP